LLQYKLIFKAVDEWSVTKQPFLKISDTFLTIMLTNYFMEQLLVSEIFSTSCNFYQAIFGDYAPSQQNNTDF
jgi:hypothetical protein